MRAGRLLVAVPIGMLSLIATTLGSQPAAQADELTVTVALSDSELFEGTSERADLVVTLSAPNTTGAAVVVSFSVDGPGSQLITIEPRTAELKIGQQTVTLTVTAINNRFVNFEGIGIIFVDGEKLPDSVTVGDPGHASFAVIDDEIAPPVDDPAAGAPRLERLQIPGHVGDGVHTNAESFVEVARGDGRISLLSDGSLVLDADGNPVMVFNDFAAAETALLRCNDTRCAGADVSRARVGDLGFISSVALDSTGLPIVASVKDLLGGLQIVHCNDTRCLGSDESPVMLVSLPMIGAGLSLNLDAGGNPVVGLDFTPVSGGLRIVRCNDPSCAGNDDVAVGIDGTSDAESAGSMVLDAVDHPVVGFIRGDPAALHVLRCNDPGCAGGDESIAQVAFIGDRTIHLSMILDAQSNPVIAYSDMARGELRLLRCNDPRCVGGDESIVVLDTIAGVEATPSLALDVSDHPVVAFRDFVNEDLKIVRCADPGCLAGWVVVVDSLGDVGLDPSLQLDALGFPVIAYNDATNQAVKLVHCDDPICVTTIADVAPSTTATPEPGIPTTVIDPRNGELPATGRSAHVSMMATALLLSGLGLLLVARRRARPQPSSW